jgi:antitoxin (DNA-binding transcriptional repressor) of toxin-antitoxin stability system
MKRVANVGVRELRRHASQVRARVLRGETVEVTLRGEVVARIVPSRGTVWDERLAAGSIRGASGPALESFTPIESAAMASLTLKRRREDERRG